MPTPTDLTPRLVVDDPHAALEFYQRTLDAELIERFEDPEGRLVHSALSVGNAIVSVVESVPGWGLVSPNTLGGSPCLPHLNP